MPLWLDSDVKSLDEIDVQLLKALQADGRITNADLARLVILSPPSTLQRVRALEVAGYIKGYHARLDPPSLGLSVTVLAMVSLSLTQDRAIEQFRREVATIPEIVACYHVSGEFDYLLKIVVRDIPAYEALIRERITKIQGIGKVTSSFVLATTKDSPELPIS